MSDTIQGYAFKSDEHGVFTPDGKCADGFSGADVQAANRETERKESEWLKTGPHKVTLYAKLAPQRQDMARVTYSNQMTLSGSIQTWLGTVIDNRAWFGPRRYMGFGYGSYRRAVTCTLYGVKYHGWFMESSGDYCRLTRAKRQGKVSV